MNKRQKKKLIKKYIELETEYYNNFLDKFENILMDKYMFYPDEFIASSDSVVDQPYAPSDQ